MRSFDATGHWDRVYSTRQEQELSWHENEPHLSLRLIQEVAPDRASRILDAGAGTSALAARLLAAGYRSVAVLDVSETATATLRDRLGSGAAQVRFIVTDLLEADDLGEFDVWHDRAVFHFLTRPADRERYLRLAERTLAPGGHLVIATFAPEGPEQCSGLPVCRYGPDELTRVVGQRFSPVRFDREIHRTPWGAGQPFLYGIFRATG